MLKRFIVFIHIRFFLRFIIFIAMKNCDVFTSENFSFLFAFLTVLNHGFDRCARVRTRKHQTHLSNIAMNNIRHILFNLICINREGHNITMLDKKLASLARFRVIKCTICINAFVTVLKKSVAKNLIWVIMTMIPNKRNGLTIIVLKSIFHDNSAIRAFEICFGSPSAKIEIFHFDFILLLLNFSCTLYTCLGLLLFPQYCYYAIHQP